MKVTLLKDGSYAGLYRADSGIIYTREEAEVRFPKQFKNESKETPTAVKKSAKRTK